MDSHEKRFLDTFARAFADYSPPDLRSLLASLRFRTMARGEVIMREGDACTALPFVLEGRIRVYRTAESGREITLYRIGSGESCILSSGCVSGAAAFPGTAVAETETSAAFLPAARVNRLFAESAAFRSFVLSQYSARMADIIELVEEVAFRHVDERLAELLVELSASAGVEFVAATHQELASSIGTSREVVSRILKDWEDRGALELKRGEIVLLPGFKSTFR
jgi:CRP/FNR family transcriptional regulator, anaerobic regulatory protein